MLFKSLISIIFVVILCVACKIDKTRLIWMLIPIIVYIITNIWHVVGLITM